MAPRAGVPRISSVNKLDWQTVARGSFESQRLSGALANRRVSHMSQVPRCGANTRAGTPCQSPPVPGRTRCRLHGGLSPGAPRGSRNGNYTNGEWTAEAIEERRWLRSLVRDFGSKGTRL
jgi:hypothetical protein